MSFLPPTSDTDVFSLLSLVSDPEATKARLQELNKTKAELAETINQSRSISEQANKDRLAARQDLDSILLERREHQEQVDRDKADLTKLKLEADARVIQANQLEVQSTSRSNRISDLESKVNQRLSEAIAKEHAIAKRETGVSVRETTASALIDKHNSILANLKNIVNA